jgi:hypothetical protein
MISVTALRFSYSYVADEDFNCGTDWISANYTSVFTGVYAFGHNTDRSVYRMSKSQSRKPKNALKYHI